MSKRLVKKVLLIGWGSADWKVIDPLIEDNKLPNLQKLVTEGTKASMGTLDPPTLPATWNTMVTGKIPAKHQTTNFATILQEQAQPITVSSRKAKTLWNIVSEQGLKAHQVGCWASHGETNINGISISDLYPFFSKDNLPDDAIFPLDQKDNFANLLVAPQDITNEQLQAYVSQKTLENPAHQSYIDTIKSFLAHSHSIQNAAVHILENDQDWDNFNVFFNQMSNLTFRFMAFHIKDNEDVSTELKNAFGQVISVAYQQLDAFLGTIIEKAGDETTVFLASQGGFLPDPLWIKKIERPYSTWEYNTQGILVFRGQNASQKEQIFTITNLDIPPTILALLGLPIAKDFDGKIILNRKFFNKLENVVETFEKEGNPEEDSFKENFLNTNLAPIPNEILQRQLQDLGYLTDDLDILKEQQQYINARTQIATGGQEEVIKVLEELWIKHPENSWYGGRLAGCYLSLNRPEEANDLLNTVLSLGEEIPELHLLKGRMLITEMKYRSAVKEFNTVEKNVGMMPNIYTQLAESYAGINQWQEAVKQYKQELIHNPHPATYLGLGMLYVQNKKIKLSIDPLQKAVDYAPNHPAAQYHLGNALFQTGDYERSAEALEVAKKFMPDPQARQRIQQMLVSIYRDHLKKPEKLKEMQEAFEKSIGSRGTITIVSGLPRSGTSMMMQMLVNGGLTAFTDGKREADDNNKKGYYEHEAVKNLAKDKKFLRDVGDNVVKIISHLLHHLPHVFHYKIVFMDRAIEEVMTSQHKMLGRLGKERGEDKEKSMKLLKTFEDSRQKAIKWCENKKRFVDLLVVPYHEAISNPLVQAKRVNEFLGGTLDEMAMAAVVDKSLYREKAKDIKV